MICMLQLIRGIEMKRRECTIAIRVSLKRWMKVSMSKNYRLYLPGDTLGIKHVQNVTRLIPFELKLNYALLASLV